MDKQETKLPATEMNAGQAATDMIVRKLIQKIKRSLGEEGQALKISREDMAAFGIYIFQEAVGRVSGEETKELDEQRIGEIALKIVEHQFLKGH